MGSRTQATTPGVRGALLADAAGVGQRHPHVPARGPVPLRPQRPRHSLPGGPEVRPQGRLHRPRRPVPQRRDGHAAGDVRQYGGPARRSGLAAGLAGVAGAAHWHCVLRFDDGRLVWNIEASNTEGGFRTNPDSYYQTEYNIPQGHIDCGSDLTFLRPRQLLGHFIGRGAGTGGICSTPAWPTGRRGLPVHRAGQEDFESALALFPQSRLFRRKVDDCNLWRRRHGDKRRVVRR